MTENKPRAVQPRCTACNHAKSFHPSGKCQAFGCECKRWRTKALTPAEKKAKAKAKKARLG